MLEDKICRSEIGGRGKETQPGGKDTIKDVALSPKSRFCEGKVVQV